MCKEEKKFEKIVVIISTTPLLLVFVLVYLFHVPIPLQLGNILLYLYCLAFGLFKVFIHLKRWMKTVASQDAGQSEQQKVMRNCFIFGCLTVFIPVALSGLVFLLKWVPPILFPLLILNGYPELLTHLTRRLERG